MDLLPLAYLALFAALLMGPALILHHQAAQMTPATIEEHAE